MHVGNHNYDAKIFHYFSPLFDISFWKLDASSFDYPALAVPWDPKDAVDPRLAQIRGEYSVSML